MRVLVHKHKKNHKEPVIR